MNRKAARQLAILAKVDAIAKAKNARPCSWICTSSKGEVIEVFHSADACVLAHAEWTVETSYEYLGRINKAIRDNAR